VVVNAARLCFEGIEPAVWAHRIGGYQVLDRWLAARAGRVLRLQEIDDFRRIAAAIRLTLEVEAEIARTWPEMPGAAA
jgi:hypothetical protein